MNARSKLSPQANQEDFPRCRRQSHDLYLRVGIVCSSHHASRQHTNMNDEEYIAIPLDENGKYEDLSRTSSRNSPGTCGVIPLLLIFALVVCLGLGFEMGKQWSGMKQPVVQNLDGKLPAQSFFPESSYLAQLSRAGLIFSVPTKKVVFNFPTNFDDTGAVGDKLWNDLMPGDYLLCLGRDLPTN